MNFHKADNPSRESRFTKGVVFMVQFYFLSIVINVLVGLILLYGTDFTTTAKISIREEKSASKVRSTIRGKKNEEEEVKELPLPKHNPLKGIECIDNKTFRLVVGILCAFVGIMKLLTVFKNDVPFIGDLLPALCGFSGAASLLIEYYLLTTTEETELPVWMHKVFVANRKYVGIACLAASVLHFVFPQVVLL